MKSGYVLFANIAAVILWVSCGQYCGKIHNISKEIDLQGDTLEIPEGEALRFKKNGKIVNGAIRGNGTELLWSGNAIFDNVIILGSWNTPELSSRMFVNRPEMLKQLFALSNPDIKNTIHIEEGEYEVSARFNNDDCLIVASNTDVVIDGNIHLLPNDFQWSNIIVIEGENIRVSGTGSIVGDCKDHFGEGGEWGMGIRVRHSNNVTIDSISIKECWGDCIYVGGKSDNVLISKCDLSDSRRQGISITSARKVIVSDCTIRNIRGTDPEFAIDVEPNRSDTTEFVSIRNVKAIDCEGGFKCWKHVGDGSLIKEVEIYGCSVEGIGSKEPYSWIRAEKVTMKNCTFSNRSLGIYFEDVKEIVE